MEIYLRKETRVVKTKDAGKAIEISSFFHTLQPMRFVFTPHVYTLMGLYTRGGVEALNSSLCTPTHPPSKIEESASLPWEYGRMRAGCSPSRTVSCKSRGSAAIRCFKVSTNLV